MRYQERIYIQNENRAVRNKDILNVNMSSDFAIFKSPTFDISGATKLPCGQITCNLTGYSFNNILTAATSQCLTATTTLVKTLSSTDWSSKIYKDNILVYTDNFYSTTLSGDLPTEAFFLGSVSNSLQSLGYGYEQDGTIFTIQKPLDGGKSLDIDICINFNVNQYTCPVGYSATPANDNCQRIIISAATFNGLGGLIQNGNTDVSYSMYGCSFYPKIQTNQPLPVYYSGTTTGSTIGKLVNATGGTIQPIITVTGSTFWANPSLNFIDGRLNKIGLSASSTEFLGFSKCVDITEAGTYYIGMGADNDCRFKVDGTLFANFSGSVVDNFRKWSVFEVDLTSGTHIIEMEGFNSSGPSSFGAEIYNPTSFAALTAATTTGETGMIFSTQEFRNGTSRWQIGQSIGYSCSAGFSLSTCVTASTAYTCTQISSASITAITANCLNDCITVCGDDFPYVDNTSRGVFIIDPTTTTSIPLTFNFTGNTDVFTATSASFKYNIYKYNSDLEIFTVPPVYKSDTISYSAFSGTNILQQSIPITAITFDNQYAVKGFYEFNALTDYSNRLGKKIDTSIYAQYGDYQLYNPNLDYYFVGITYAESPIFSDTALTSLTYSNDVTLQQQVIYVDDYLEYLTRHSTSPSTPDYGPDNATGSTYYRTGSIFVLQNTYRGDVFVTLNGLTLAKNMDYTLSGQTLTMLGPITNGDIITIVYTRDGNNSTLISESVEVNTSIPSGPTNGQGNNKYYYNTTTSKYEVYTNNEPVTTANVILILNGITLLKDIDYYQSTSNKKRIILNGTIMVGDIITIVYYPTATMINGITDANTLIRWYIETPPQDSNGRFIVEYATTPTFTTYSINSIVPYSNGNTGYDTILNLTGSAGTNVYYRVKNEKNYVTICGDKIGSTAYSETVRVIIQSNAINSY